VTEAHPRPGIPPRDIGHDGLGGSSGLDECSILPAAACLLLPRGLGYEPVACH
jgi:hypothetical protein